ncbi:MAG: c-type cytochrome [Rhodospirillaceae bacterium]|nr:c-type cytochrome [Rhodospirillaceae bacterium]MBT5082344.1 c-type cytochrome [Rhodospirillaceae bacterium]MBT5526810.1 c-type cytochrome [Rhodospirillaceae bacterium]MBT7286102.1 c-type cytochrome [Rhodospirillaceae bacterium]MBT7975289.1 c-type cytochrome [Rhodospirillaceae bacterium]
MALNAPQGNPVVRAVPQDWPAAYKQRVAAKAAYIHDKQKAFDWFAIFPFSAEDGFPLILLKLLPEVAPDIWAGGEAFLSDVGLFHDPRAKNLPLPRGVGFSGIGRGDSSAMDYTSFTCAACHMGRVKGPKGEIIHIDGGVNAEFNINAFFVKLHQTFAALSQGSEGAASKKKITEAFLAALDKVTERSDTYFYENARYGDMVFDATYEQAQIALLRKDAAAHVGAFVDYTENFVAAFTTYLDKTYDNYQPQMLKGLPGMADATGVSSSHGYEGLAASELGKKLGREFLLPGSPGITDFMAVWEQNTRTARWDPSKKQLIDGGGQYNGNIPIPIYRNLAASMTLGLKGTDLRVAAFAAELLDGLPATPYPFEVDVDLARKGQALFAKNCAACHQPNNGRVYDTLGTDPSRAEVINTLLMAGARAEYLAVCNPETVLVLYNDPIKPCEKFDGVPLADREEMIMRPLSDQGGYNATALRGLWSTAPYLHNGSVPTLYHLLLPSERPAKFTKSSLTYDRKYGGYAWDSTDSGGYVFDSTEFHALNNRGHDKDLVEGNKSFKLDWSDDIPGAFALIEYLKTL